MKHTYVIGLDGRGIDEAIRGVQEWKDWLKRKTDELAQRLANEGYEVASRIMAGHVYTGATLGSLQVEKIDDAHYVVKAESEAVLFLEFGSGLVGYGHPDPQGFGPGTYPGKGHWDDPNGWWFETDDPNLAIRTSKKTGKMYGHSYGMPPAMPMYNAVKEIEQNLESIVREVFAT